MAKPSKPSQRPGGAAETPAWRGQETRPGPGGSETAEDAATRAEGNAPISVEDAVRRAEAPGVRRESAVRPAAVPANAPDADADAERKREAAAEAHAAEQPHPYGKL